MTTILKTDAYEYTMLSSLVRDGKANDPAVFELFTRKLPTGRTFGMVAGVGRFLEIYKNWTIDTETIEFLKSVNVIDEHAAAWLTERVGGPLFTGNIYSYPEGETYFPNSPIVRVEGKLGECLLLETLLLSIYNHDSAVASAAARMVIAADGVPIIEMGSRRTDDEAALSATRAAYIAGFKSTSNLEAARKWGIPTSGTAAHAFVLSYESEIEAFTSQIETWGTETTLLVDTYDIPTGIKNAVEVARKFGATGPAAIRIDSGDPREETVKARELLDSLGATNTKIVLSSDLDEYVMSNLRGYPVNGYGAGTRVVTGSGAPTASMVYKLVEINGRKVAKKSDHKASVGGSKTPFRVGEQEFYTLDGTVRGEPLQVQYVSNGSIIEQPSLTEIRAKAAETLKKLSADITAGEPITTAVLF